MSSALTSPVTTTQVFSIRVLGEKWSEPGRFSSDFGVCMDAMTWKTSASKATGSAAAKSAQRASECWVGGEPTDQWDDPPEIPKQHRQLVSFFRSSCCRSPVENDLQQPAALPNGVRRCFLQARSVRDRPGSGAGRSAVSVIWYWHGRLMSGDQFISPAALRLPHCQCCACLDDHDFKLQYRIVVSGR